MPRHFRLSRCLLVAAALAAAPPLHAQVAAPPAAPVASASAAADTALPLRDVVLFSSGVGYFQRIARVNGTADVNLSFRAEQINDILKSLVLIDPAGSVRPATYTTSDSITRRLRAAGLSVSGDMTLGTLLRQFQGVRVRLELGAEAVEGRILSVSNKQVPFPAPLPVTDRITTVVTVEVLNLLTETGLRAVPLDQVTQVKLLDERLDRELRESLAILATGLDDQRRTVSLHFAGNAPREVRAGYLQEMPVWKTSYRLVLDPKQKPYLQGWAIVENTTDEDWTDVRLSLVSGRPISFIQDLYQPLYVARPVVASQVVGSPLPQTYGERLDEAGEATANAPASPPPPAAARAPMGAAGPAGGFGFGGRAASGGGAANGLFMNSGNFDAVTETRRNAGLAAEQLAAAVASQAAGTERGDLFEYAIRQPVTLPRQQAAMVPIVSENIEGDKLSIFSPSSDPRHALNGFRLRNTTGLHLSGGPITVFQEGGYAGDAQINNVQPGEDRLISYAVDLDLVTDMKEPARPQEVVALSAKSGVLHITRRLQRERVYTFRNKADAAKTVMVQQDIEPEFKLVQPTQATETSPDSYRFKVDVPGKKTAELQVVTERPVMETVALLDADLNLLLNFTQNGPMSPKLKSALQDLVARRRKIVVLQQQRANVETELRNIDQEQARIRQNMAQLDRNSPLYQQYVKKLTDQEATIEKLREDSARLRDAEEAAQKELHDFVDDITVE